MGRMGSNAGDYLREAHRTLKLDGQLHIFEATSRFADRDWFAASLRDLGFDVVAVEDAWKFTHVRALKAERRPIDGQEKADQKYEMREVLTQRAQVWADRYDP
jgi:hypothetical protein